MKKWLLLFSIAVAVFILNSCASVTTRTTHFRTVESLIQQRDFISAAQELEAGKNRYYQAKDRVLYYLDIGMLYHYAGDYQKSNEFLNEAEYAIEDLFTKSISRAAASLLLNDNVLEYSGEDYEDIYINIFKAINFLMLDEFDKAFVEIRRINDKLIVLEDKYRDLAKSYQLAEEAKIDIKPGSNRYHNSILGRYLSMLIYRTEGLMDAARIDHNYIVDGWYQQSHIYNFTKPDLSSHLNTQNKTKVNFISFIGRAPIKKSYERRITTFENHLIVSGNEPTDFTDIIIWPGLDKDLHFKFSLPIMQRRESQISRVRIYVDNNSVADLKKIEDINQVATETFKIKAPIIYLKSVIRSVAKGLIAEQAKQRVRSQSSELGGFLFRVFADVAVDISESADLRIARYFPGEALIGEIELDPGIYSIRVAYYNRYGSVVYEDHFERYEVKHSDLNLIHSFCLK